MQPRLVLCNIPVDPAHNEAALKFYGALLGRKLIRSLTKQRVSYHAPTSAGVQLSLGPKHSARETVTCYFAVPDLKRTIGELKELNAKLVVNPFHLPSIGGGGGGTAAGCSNEAFFGDPDPNLGEAAVVQDPAGNLVGLIQLNKTAEVWFQGEVTQREIESYDHGAVAAAKLLR